MKSLPPQKSDLVSEGIIRDRENKNFTSTSRPQPHWPQSSLTQGAKHLYKVHLHLGPPSRIQSGVMHWWNAHWYHLLSYISPARWLQIAKNELSLHSINSLHAKTRSWCTPPRWPLPPNLCPLQYALYGWGEGYESIFKHWIL